MPSPLFTGLPPTMQNLPIVEHHNLNLLFNNIRSVSERFHDVNQNGVQFLLIDLDLGLTFMDVAEASCIQETTRRNHNNARKAYDAVLHLLENLRPSVSERQVIDAKLALLKARLRAVGHQF